MSPGAISGQQVNRLDRSSEEEIKQLTTREIYLAGLLGHRTGASSDGRQRM
jgi:hypothetical protein